MIINCLNNCKYQNNGKCNYNSCLISKDNTSCIVNCVFYSQEKQSDTGKSSKFWSDISKKLFQ